MKYFNYLLISLLFSCSVDESAEDNPNGVQLEVEHEHQPDTTQQPDVFIQVLGTVQDGGSPHIGCKKDCCKDLFSNPDTTRLVVSLGVVDNIDEKSWLFEATPDMTRQLKVLKRICHFQEEETPDGIFVTHAHIGHYAGLMYLGQEAMGATEVPVYAMPRMKKFLEEHGPWSQLVNYKNIAITEMKNGAEMAMSSQVKVTPFVVPHRDEYSETVGFKIAGPSKSALFIPDINKWDVWEKSVIEETKKVDYAFLDATFYGQDELKNRDMSEIPHPFIVETMDVFKDESDFVKNKVYFIHLNHSNPALFDDEIISEIESKGFHVAKYMDRFPL